MKPEVRYYYNCLYRFKYYPLMPELDMELFCCSSREGLNNPQDLDDKDISIQPSPATAVVPEKSDPRS